MKLAFLAILAANAVAETFLLDDVSVESISIGGWLSPGDSLVPSPSTAQLPAATPLWSTSSVSECTADASCLIRLSIAGELAVYSNGKVVSVIAAASGFMRSTDYVYWLEVSEDGDVVLSALSAEEDEENVIWHSGSRFPVDCDATCKKGAVLIARPDGSLVLQRGVSAVTQAYLDFGAPAAARLRSCLCDNGFTSDAAVNGGGVAAPPLGERIGECRVPPALVLVSYFNSGTTRILQATSVVTSHAVFTDEDDVEMSAGHMLEMMKMQSMCGIDVCADLGLCTMHCEHCRMSELPPAGKGALVKSRAVDYGKQGGCTGADCVSDFQEALTAEGRRDPYGVLRVHRNPFDHLVARFYDMDEVDSIDDDDLSESRKAFLESGAAFVKEELPSYLEWHLNANLALQNMGKPTALLYYEDMYVDPASYIRKVVAMLGWSETEVPGGILEEEMKATKSRALDTTEAGEIIPVYLERFYDVKTIQHVANTINDVLDRTDCLRAIPSQ